MAETKTKPETDRTRDTRQLAAAASELSLAAMKLARILQESESHKADRRPGAA